MTATHDAFGDATPRHVLPLRSSRGGITLNALLRSVVDEVAGQRRRQRLPQVAITIDAGQSREPAADADRVKATLTLLVSAACDAATVPDPASDGPRLHEVVVTAVETSHGTEIEVADSGPGPEFRVPDAFAAAQRHAERLGGSLVVMACPDGGMAVTLRLGSCHDHGQAIRPAA